VITLQQAQERAEQWINADVPAHKRREVRVRPFGLGFVAWAQGTQDTQNGPSPSGGGLRLVIAHEDGRVTLWPGLPVDEVIRQYVWEYGDGEPEPEQQSAQTRQRVDLEATSFLLSPPQWLQDAADKLGPVPSSQPGSRGLATPDGEAGLPPGGSGAPDLPPPTGAPLGASAEASVRVPPTAPPLPPPSPPAPPGGVGAAYSYLPPQPQLRQAPPGAPVVGPGYMAVLRYRASDGSEQQIIRRSAPGTPHPEWQILYELRDLGVPPQQVLELHTELESCNLPGGYCARMIREIWPQVRVSHTASYGRDHASRQQGFQKLLAHQSELHQVADGPARPHPQRVPLPAPQQVQPASPLPLEAIGQELVQAFGPQALFRYDQRAVARAGVPDAVAQCLVWAGLPRDFSPFFWGYVPQPGRPVPTLAEVAAERGVQAAYDASSYLVMGNDFGHQLCVQYGTARIMAVPLEATQSASPSPAQFVNSGLPEFARCLALLGRMWRLRFGLTPDQAGRWTVDFQAQLAALDPIALSSPDNWWAVLLEQMWDGLL
jgi:SUKH-4 immunity protein/Xanthomonas XOO_2897-like deaminase